MEGTNPDNPATEQRTRSIEGSKAHQGERARTISSRTENRVGLRSAQRWSEGVRGARRLLIRLRSRARPLARYRSCLLPFVCFFSLDWLLTAWAMLLATGLPQTRARDVLPFVKRLPGLEGLAGELPLLGLWGLSFFIFAVTAVILLSISIALTWNALADRTPRRRLTVLLTFSFALALYLFVFADWFIRGGASVTDLWVHLIEGSLGLPFLSELLVGYNFGVFIVLFYLTLVNGTLLAPPAAASRHGVEAIAWRMQKARLLLYLGAVVLVSGTIELRALNNIPVAWLPTSKVKIVTNLAATISSFAGAAFSIGLISLYVPTHGVLYLRAVELAREMGGSLKDQREWLEANGIVASPWKRVLTLLTLLGPVLAGGPLEVFSGILEKLL